MTLDVILNFAFAIGAALLVMWRDMGPWSWVAAGASAVALIIISVRRTESQDPSLEEQCSDFAQLLPKDPPVVIDRRFTSYRRKETP
jgi:hypothetical protein